MYASVLFRAQLKARAHLTTHSPTSTGAAIDRWLGAAIDLWLLPLLEGQVAQALALFFTLDSQVDVPYHVTHPPAKS